MHSEVAAVAEGQGKRALDLAHTRNLNGFRQSNALYRDLQDEGLIRYIGIARSGSQSFATIEQLIRDGLVDFIQVNYSLAEPQAAERLLPLAADEGVGVCINRPFINGRYFGVVSDNQLPEWAAEFDCESWAQFCLLYTSPSPRD